MSSLPKLKLSQLYTMDRFDDKSEQQAMAGVQDNYFAFSEQLKIQLKDDGLGKYKIENENFVSVFTTL